MSRSWLTLCAVLLALVPGLRAGEAWSQLKLGMTADETRTKLGNPMLRTSGKGFETWIYDRGAEAVLYGSLIGWTSPAAANESGPAATSAPRSVDIWSTADHSAERPLTFLSLLPQPPAPPPPKRVAPASPSLRPDDAWVPLYMQRRR